MKSWWTFSIQFPNAEGKVAWPKEGKGPVLYLTLVFADQQSWLLTPSLLLFPLQLLAYFLYTDKDGLLDMEGSYSLIICILLNYSSYKDMTTLYSYSCLVTGPHQL